MPLNGSGGVTQPTGSIYPAVASTLIESAKFNTSIADIYTILASALYKDGQQTATQSIPFAQGLSTNTITERTSASGVTIDSLVIKDGGIADTNGNEAIKIGTTASAVNEVTITNAAASGEPSIAATGDDTDIDLVLVSKGAGHVTAADDDFAIKGSADGTKRVRFEVDGLTTGNTRVGTVPDHNFTIPNFPAGFVVPYAGTTEPDGWLFCYGQAVSRTTYSSLFTAISTTYGVGDGSTTFNLPDLRGRVVAGKDDMGSTSANRLTDQSGGLDGDVLGDTGGSETHTLVTGEMPSHVHSNRVGTSTGGSGWFGTGTALDSTEDTGSAGGDDPHNNVQPTIILNYLIKT